MVKNGNDEDDEDDDNDGWASMTSESTYQIIMNYQLNAGALRFCILVPLNHFWDSF